MGKLSDTPKVSKSLVKQWVKVQSNPAPFVYLFIYLISHFHVYLFIHITSLRTFSVRVLGMQLHWLGSCGETDHRGSVRGLGPVVLQAETPRSGRPSRARQSPLDASVPRPEPREHSRCLPPVEPHVPAHQLGTEEAPCSCWFGLCLSSRSAAGCLDNHILHRLLSPMLPGPAWPRTQVLQYD